MRNPRTASRVSLLQPFITKMHHRRLNYSDAITATCREKRLPFQSHSTGLPAVSSVFYTFKCYNMMFAVQVPEEVTCDEPYISAALLSQLLGTEKSHGNDSQRYCLTLIAVQKTKQKKNYNILQ